MRTPLMSQRIYKDSPKEERPLTPIIKRANHSSLKSLLTKVSESLGSRGSSPVCSPKVSRSFTALDEGKSISVLTLGSFDNLLEEKVGVVSFNTPTSTSTLYPTEAELYGKAEKNASFASSDDSESSGDADEFCNDDYYQAADVIAAKPRQIPSPFPIRRVQFYASNSSSKGDDFGESSEDFQMQAAIYLSLGGCIDESSAEELELAAAIQASIEATIKTAPLFVRKMSIKGKERAD